MIPPTISWLLMLCCPLRSPKPRLTLVAVLRILWLLRWDLACGALFRASIKCLVKLLTWNVFFYCWFFLGYQCFDSALSKFRDSEVESLNFGFFFFFCVVSSLNFVCRLRSTVILWFRRSNLLFFFGFLCGCWVFDKIASWMLFLSVVLWVFKYCFLSLPSQIMGRNLLAEVLQHVLYFCMICIWLFEPLHCFIIFDWF